MKVPSNKLEQMYIQLLALLAKAIAAIPGQAQTLSKGWMQYPLGAAPVFAIRADGGYVWDSDGNRYVDWPMALGPLLLVITIWP